MRHGCDDCEWCLGSDETSKRCPAAGYEECPGRLTDSAAGSYAWLEIELRSDRAQEMIGRQMRDERIEFSDALFYSRSCLGCKERKEHELTT